MAAATTKFQNTDIYLLSHTIIHVDDDEYPPLNGFLLAVNVGDRPLVVSTVQSSAL